MKGKRRPVGIGMTPTTTDFGRLIRECRLVLGLSQAAVAKHAGICQTEYSALETGAVRYVNPEYIEGLARGLQCKAASLNAVAPRKPAAEPKTAKGRFILARREAIGLSRNELAQRLETVARTISVLELGERERIQPKTAKCLAEALELNVSAFGNFIWFKGSEPKSAMGRLVRSRRYELHLNQRQLAERTNKTPQFISLIETGKIPLSSNGRTLGELATALNLDAAVLAAAKPPRKLKKIKTGNILGALVAGERAKLGLTQTELGRRAGLSPATVSDIERRTYHPRQRTLAKMQSGLGCEIPPELVSSSVQA